MTESKATATVANSSAVVIRRPSPSEEINQYPVTMIPSPKAHPNSQAARLTVGLSAVDAPCPLVAIEGISDPLEETGLASPALGFATLWAISRHFADDRNHPA